MYYFSKSVFRLLALSILVVGSGCYESTECEGTEVCDYLDNNCNRQIDESFRDENGVYDTAEHCGGCGINCSQVLSTAASTACVLRDGSAACVVTSCPEGFQRVSETRCVEIVPVTCNACTTTADCRFYDPDSECAQVAGENRCLDKCVSGACSDGFSCGPDELCRPLSGECRCTAEIEGAEFGCLVEDGSGKRCAATQLCSAAGLGVCETTLPEICNNEDDNCDGNIDEDFVDADGLYLSPEHCGGCGIACVAPGPNFDAECTNNGGVAVCGLACTEGFVDVDGILSNGCECQIREPGGAPAGGDIDTDCDGTIDVTDDFIYVTQTGSDTNPGSLEMPKRTLLAATTAASSQNKNVLVARGIYRAGLAMVADVDVIGGYRPDFRDRDIELFPVVIELANQPGRPVVQCSNITTPTRLAGVTIEGSNAVASGQGSTALNIDGCSAAVSFEDVVVVAGRGASGVSGESSSERLASLGFMSLADLNGTDGSQGGIGGNSCPGPGQVAGGLKQCPSGAASGGFGGASTCPDIMCTNGSACGNAGCTDFTTNGVCDIAAAIAVAVPNPAAQDGFGVGGGRAGEQTYDAPTNRTNCNFCDDNPTLPRLGQRGGDGRVGVDGNAGLGCQQRYLLSAAGTFSGAGGSDGSSGSDGAGGGGGTAGGGFTRIGGTTGSCSDRPGGAGGGGGSGGCGAPSTGGGTGGGVSVAILISLDAAQTGPTFERTRVITASGGAGGAGGVGATGGRPGVGALGGSAEFFCARTGGRGGDGGRGGTAGGGGGGCGGGAHAFIVRRSTEPTAYVADLGNVDVQMVGTAGVAGEGGFSSAAPGVSGLDGLNDSVLFLAP